MLANFYIPRLSNEFMGSNFVHKFNPSQKRGHCVFGTFFGTCPLKINLSFIKYLP